jgi:Immunity protein 22
MSREKKGFVSVWIGTFDNETEFENYTEEKYGQINHLPLSKFAQESELNWYDHDLREAFFNIDGVTSIRSLLVETSYSESFIDAIVQKNNELKIEEGNAVFLLFDCFYSPSGKEKGKFRFIASVPYNKMSPPATS